MTKRSSSWHLVASLIWMRPLLMPMRIVLVIACIIARLGIARADSFPEYPQEYTDRPILRPQGMTELSFALDLPTSSTTIVDMGTTTTTRTKLGDHVEPELGLVQSFGSVEANLGVAPNLYAGTSVQLGDLRARAFASFEYLPPVGGLRHYYGEGVGIAYKALVEPKRFAVFATAHADAIQFAHDATTEVPASAGHLWSASARVLAELQLTHRLALLVDPGITIVLANSSTTVVPTELHAGAELLLALGRWDVHGEFRIVDVADRRLPFVAMGAALRF